MQKYIARGRGMSEVVKNLPNKCKALNSNPSTAKKQNKKCVCVDVDVHIHLYAHNIRFRIQVRNQIYIHSSNKSSRFVGIGKTVEEKHNEKKIS
jgi:hypothetical protein